MFKLFFTFILTIALNTNAFAIIDIESITTPPKPQEKDDWSYYTIGFSKHLMTDGLNESHEFKGVLKNNFLVGSFINSFNNPTTIVGYRFNYNLSENFQDLEFAKNINYGVIAGGIYGYTCDQALDFIPCKGDVMAAAVPYVEYDKYAIKPNLALLGEAVFLSFRVSI